MHLLQVNYFHFIAEEIRAGLASLGLRSLDELTGRSDLLKQRDHQLSKTEGLDLSFITQFAGPCKSTNERAHMEVSHPLNANVHCVFASFYRGQKPLALLQRMDT